MMAVLLLVVMLARMLTLVSSPQDASEGREKKRFKKIVSRAWKVALTRRGKVARVEKVGILSQTVNLDSSLRLLRLKKKKKKTQKKEKDPN